MLQTGLFMFSFNEKKLLQINEQTLQFRAKAKE